MGGSGPADGKARGSAGSLPEYAGSGIGYALQDARLREMARLGVEKVTTNADRTELGEPTAPAPPFARPLPAR